MVFILIRPEMLRRRIAFFS